MTSLKGINTFIDGFVGRPEFAVIEENATDIRFEYSDFCYVIETMTFKEMFQIFHGIDCECFSSIDVFFGIK